MTKLITRFTRNASKALRSGFLVCCLVAAVLSALALTLNKDVSLSISPTQGLNFSAVQPSRVEVSPGTGVKPAVAAPPAFPGAASSPKE